MVVNAVGRVNVTGMMCIANDTYFECGLNVIECSLRRMQSSGAQHEFWTQRIIVHVQLM